MARCSVISIPAATRCHSRRSEDLRPGAGDGDGRTPRHHPDDHRVPRHAPCTAPTVQDGLRDRSRRSAGEASRSTTIGAGLLSQINGRARPPTRLRSPVPVSRFLRPGVVRIRSAAACLPLVEVRLWADERLREAALVHDVGVCPVGAPDRAAVATSRTSSESSGSGVEVRETRRASRPRTRNRASKWPWSDEWRPLPLGPVHDVSSMASRNTRPRPPAGRTVAVAWRAWYRPVRYAASTAFHHARRPGRSGPSTDGRRGHRDARMDGRRRSGTAPGSTTLSFNRGADEGEATHDQQAATRAIPRRAPVEPRALRSRRPSPAPKRRRSLAPPQPYLHAVRIRRSMSHSAAL